MHPGVKAGRIAKPPDASQHLNARVLCNVSRPIAIPKDGCRGAECERQSSLYQRLGRPWFAPTMTLDQRLQVIVHTCIVSRGDQNLAVTPPGLRQIGEGESGRPCRLCLYDARH
jgi:hypothetical protein